jgi:YHS domain-containing protein
MTRLILFTILLLILYIILHFLVKGMPVQRRKLNVESEPEELVQDPYCQTYIAKKSALKKKIGGRLLYFCDQECLRRFLQERDS